MDINRKEKKEIHEIQVGTLYQKANNIFCNNSHFLGKGAMKY